MLPDNSVFAALPDAQHITGFNSFTTLYIRYTDYPTAKAHVEDINHTIAATGTYIPIFTFNEDPAKNSLIAFTQTSGGVMAMLGMMALVVSGFLVFNVLTAIVTEQRQQIGVMKSVGAIPDG